ncbi:hypothetical protein ABPH35_02685 [Streptococcus sp. ZJ93]|uniref:hypothetical protein n=1 Tax=Streptococcus handemini TaxID=3161188 RepID=UPI0034D5B52C
MIATLFFVTECPDTAPFVAGLKELSFDYEDVEITANLANFKRFIRLRDQHPAFQQAKENGYVGMPALQIGEEVFLDLSEVKDFLDNVK